MSVLKPLDWIIILVYFAHHPRPGLEDHAREAEDLDRLLPGRPPPRLAHHRRLHLRLEHRRRAPRRPGRLGRDRRRGHGPLRAPRLVPARPGLGHGAVLHALEGLHHARVPGAALLAGRPDGPVAHLARRLRPDQDGRRHLRRRHRLQRPPARAELVRPRQLLDRLDPGHPHHRALHGPRRAQGRRLHRGHPDVHLHHRLGPGDLLRPEGPRRLGRAPRDRRLRRCSTSGSRSSPPGSRGPGRRSRRPAGWPGTSTTTTPGSACSSARPSSACGTGAPTSTSSSGSSAPPTSARPGAAPSPRASSSSCPSSSSSSRA